MIGHPIRLRSEPSATATRSLAHRVKSERKVDETFDAGYAAHPAGGGRILELKPDKPADEPDVLFPCKVCGVPKAKIKDNFEIYWSHNKWNWRPECKMCHAARPAKRKEEVKRHIWNQVHEGQPLSCRAIMRLMGRSDDRTIRKDWDEAAAKGEVPPRPGAEPKIALSPKQLERREGGRLLLDIEARLRGVIHEIGNASPKYQANARDFWLRHLAIIAKLTDEATGMVTGGMLDGVLEQWGLSTETVKDPHRTGKEEK